MGPPGAMEEGVRFVRRPRPPVLGAVWGKGLILEQNGRILARYSVNNEMQKRIRKKLHGPLTSGLKSTLSSSSLDRLGHEAEAHLEIFCSGPEPRTTGGDHRVLFCRERRRSMKNKENEKDVELFGEIVGGVADSSGA
ncbi:hypothetical protein F4679DRAFT_533466 [Xylaria curta]|nr:hypothetical protein F4679DRAFT_533466 [Xylaria curta]